MVLAAHRCDNRHRLATVQRPRRLGLHRNRLVLAFGLFLGLGRVSLRPWLNNPRYGWVWRPGNIWAPAWVAWRNTSEHAGWAPLPPGAPLNLGGRSPAAFGLTASSFVFVRFEYFLKPHVESFAESPNDAAVLFRSSTAANNYTVSGGKIFNLGVTTSQISSAIHRPVRQFALQDVSTAGSANQSLGRGVLAVYRPVVAEKTAANNGDSRLAQLETSEGTVPAREIPAPTNRAASKTALNCRAPPRRRRCFPECIRFRLRPARTSRSFPLAILRDGSTLWTLIIRRAPASLSPLTDTMPPPVVPPRMKSDPRRITAASKSDRIGLRSDRARIGQLLLSPEAWLRRRPH